jgi:hypothetical protein
VFVSDRNGSENLWVSDADGGNARALTTGERDNYVSPSWTPDGQYIVATKGAQLWLFHKDGGTGLQITGLPRAGAPAPAPGQGGPPLHLGAAFGNDPRYLWVNVRGMISGAFGFGNEPPAPIRPDHAPGLTLARSASTRSACSIARPLPVMVPAHELEGALPVPSPDGNGWCTRRDGTREALKQDLATGQALARDGRAARRLHGRRPPRSMCIRLDLHAPIRGRSSQLRWQDLATRPPGRRTGIRNYREVEQQVGPSPE